ncbi:MAG TPA: hypothetical protein PLQ97_13900 [Myxococcota bacterium]|nr:hypothetical protein [Myxococcota bacterium]HQK52300.1 hypothetical protein [Myxococcota bacterium]
MKRTASRTIERVLGEDLAIRLREAMTATSCPEDAVRALDHLLPEATIQVRDDVPTARIVMAGDRFRIEFGRAFLDKELQDPRDLAFVFLHEVYHHVLGHLSRLPARWRDPGLNLVVNLAGDMMVNRHVLDHYFEGRAVPLLERLYSSRGFPDFLLRPPASLASNPRMGEAIVERLRSTQGTPRRKSLLYRIMRLCGVPPTRISAAIQAYRAAWVGQTPFEKILDLVGALFPPDEMPILCLFPFLGNHDPCQSGCPGLPWESPSRSDCDDASWGPGGDLEEGDLDETVEPSLSPVLARAIREALVQDPQNPLRQWTALRLPGVRFEPGRQDWLMIAAGIWPGIFHGGLYRVMDENDLRAHLYIDVSNSVKDYIGRIYSLVLALQDEIGSPVHLFSTEVHDISIQDLARGRFLTTHGTDFTCVFRHAREHGYRRFLMVTDGLGEIAAEEEQAFRNSGASLYLLRIGFAGIGRSLSDPLEPLARASWDLDLA